LLLLLRSQFLFAAFLYSCTWAGFLRYSIWEADGHPSFTTWHFQRDQALLTGLDLQCKKPRKDPTLRKTASVEPQPLCGVASTYCASSPSAPQSPYRADTVRDLIEQQQPHYVLLCPISGREHQKVGMNDAAIAHKRAFRHETLDIAVLDETNFAIDDQVGAADIEVVATAALKITRLETVSSSRRSSRNPTAARTIQ